MIAAEAACWTFFLLQYFWKMRKFWDVLGKGSLLYTKKTLIKGVAINYCTKDSNILFLGGEIDQKENTALGRGQTLFFLGFGFQIE